MANMHARICVVLQGGLVQSVVTDNPDLVGVEIMVLDYDTEGVDLGSPNLVTMDEETNLQAYVRTDMIEEAAIDLAAIYSTLSAHEEAYAND